MTPHNDREVDSSKVYSTCMTWEIIDVVAQYLGSREESYCTQNSIRCLAMKHTRYSTRLRPMFLPKCSACLVYL